MFESPRDPLLFDTGTRLTCTRFSPGAARDFDSLRQEGGLSGYPSRDESPHDLVENSQRPRRCPMQTASRRRSHCAVKLIAT
ncbi:1-deoxy-D-xylulose-5-phosphate synthase N-terminal domain-containing protein [Lentzea sp. NPDC051208]|uniref:1-deoxy-D-xylulose-5-phosphate synthase N-terminal domain-containing protein n=1 Tax=Lentzea sp. NPDC051208 TaxID=3154642 RepID=UPI0034196263